MAFRAPGAATVCVSSDAVLPPAVAFNVNEQQTCRRAVDARESDRQRLLFTVNSHWVQTHCWMPTSPAHSFTVQGFYSKMQNSLSYQLLYKHPTTKTESTSTSASWDGREKCFLCAEAEGHTLNKSKPQAPFHQGASTDSESDPELWADLPSARNSEFLVPEKLIWVCSVHSEWCTCTTTIKRWRSEIRMCAYGENEHVAQLQCKGERIGVGGEV